MDSGPGPLGRPGMTPAMTELSITPITDADVEPVIALWQRCGLTRPWNDPAGDIAFAPRRANAMSPAGSFHGRVSPQRCHSAMTGSTSASVMGVMESSVIAGVIPGRPKGPGPESIATDRVYGFRARRFAAPRNDGEPIHST